eukprot:1159440-Pelagomonas_calceolata.AAC.13
MAGIKPEELDLIIFATSSPDDLFGSACQDHSPGLAIVPQQLDVVPADIVCPRLRMPVPVTQLQATIGAKNACGFDLTAACSGFVMGVITAGQYIRTGASKKVLVVGGDALSRFVDWRDRGGCVCMHIIMHTSASCKARTNRIAGLVPLRPVVLAGPCR